MFLTFRASLFFPHSISTLFQVSLPHYRKTKFLKIAVLRYKRYLELKKRHPTEFLVPCYDFDLIWHAHQAHTQHYVEHTTAYLGAALPHDDSVNDRTPGSKLSTGDNNTRLWWKAAYRTSFARDGSMWRGDPPHTYMSSPFRLGRLTGKRVLHFKKGTFDKIAVSDIQWAFKVVVVVTAWGKI